MIIGFGLLTIFGRTAALKLWIGPYDNDTRPRLYGDSSSSDHMPYNFRTAAEDRIRSAIVFCTRNDCDDDKDLPLDGLDGDGVPKTPIITVANGEDVTTPRLTASSSSDRYSDTGLRPSVTSSRSNKPARPPSIFRMPSEGQKRSLTMHPPMRPMSAVARQLEVEDALETEQARESSESEEVQDGLSTITERDEAKSGRTSFWTRSSRPISSYTFF